MTRRGISLLEVLVAVIVLAVIGGPILAHLIMSKRSVDSSTADVGAVLRAGKILEKLQTVPYARLPPGREGLASALDGAVLGVPRSAWREAFPPDGGRFEDLHQLLGAVDPDGSETYLWIREVAAAEMGLAALPAKEVTVSVLYRASGKQVDKPRRFTLRALVTGRSP